MKYLRTRITLFGILTFTVGQFPLILALAGSHGNLFASKDALFFLVSPISLVILTILLIVFVAKESPLVILALKVVIPLTILAYLMWIIFQYSSIKQNEELFGNSIFYVFDGLLIVLVISFIFDIYKASTNKKPEQ